MKKSNVILSVAAVLSAAFAGAATVSVDWSVETGPVKPVNGVGQPPMIGALGDWSMLHYLKEAGIPYSRLHDVGGWLGGGLYVDIPNLFPDFDADETDPKNYRFAFTDSLLSALEKNGVEPFFRLGVTIENWVYYKHVYGVPALPPQRILPPKDYAKWARICEHVIAHYTEGWANGFRMKISYWEIWNEPDNDVPDEKNAMFQAPFEEYIRLYGVVASHLKARFPNLKIGGYASCGFYAAVGSDQVMGANSSPRMEHFVDCAKRFLARARDGKWPLDFFSYHSYSVPDACLRQCRYADQLLNEYGFTRDRTERINNEWLPRPSHDMLGTAAQAAMIGAELIGFQNGPVDLACIYDAKCGIGNYSPLFNPMTYKPHKAYYCFVAFNELRKLGKAVDCRTPDGLYAAAATDGQGNGAVMIANISGADQPLGGAFGDFKVVETRIIDEKRDYQVVQLPNVITDNAVLLIKLAK